MKQGVNESRQRRRLFLACRARRLPWVSVRAIFNPNADVRNLKTAFAR
jgi:hypothetical protein